MSDQQLKLLREFRHEFRKSLIKELARQLAKYLVRDGTWAN